MEYYGSVLILDAERQQLFVESNGFTNWLTWIPVNSSRPAINIFGPSDFGQHTYNGTTGGDLIMLGTWQVNTINAGAGNDTIILHDGELMAFYNSWLPAPKANPHRIDAGAGNDHVSSSELNDVINGGSGFDVIMYSWSLFGVRVDLNARTASGGSAQFDVLSNFEGLYGSTHDDRLVGTSAANDLRGNAGNDTILGLAGNDTIYGDIGNDQLFGGDGNDVMWAAVGTDSIYGENGDDDIRGRGDGDLLNGGAGNDLASFGTASAAVTVDMSTGRVRVAGLTTFDTLVSIERVSASSYADKMYGGDGHDDLNGQAGNDTLAGRAGNDTLRGNLGEDKLYGGLGNDQLSGEDGNDQLYGEDADDRLSGGNGNDLIHGNSGADTLWGNSGNDTLNGGMGVDRLYGDAGNDELTGGAGADQFIIVRDGTTSRDVITDFVNNFDTIILSGFNVTSFAGLAAVATVQNGDDLLLTFGNQSLLITNTSLASLADDLSFA
jgi:Ca2+-binding RTX toxin-like protein